VLCGLPRVNLVFQRSSIEQISYNERGTAILFGTLRYWTSSYAVCDILLNVTDILTTVLVLCVHCSNTTTCTSLPQRP
jgi:hypothetical protein